MRYLIFTLLAVVLCTFAKAQTGTQIPNTPIYYTSDYVGIGNPNPQNTLDVNGTLYVKGNAGRTSIQLADKSWSGSHAILFNAYKSENPVDGSLLTYGNTKFSFDEGPYSSGAGSIMYFGNGGVMGFYISQHSSGSGTNVNWGVPKMCIKRDGNVGIGTSSPDQRLSVNGTIQAEEVRVENVPSSDYVFEPEYNLLPITEVEPSSKKTSTFRKSPQQRSSRRMVLALGRWMICC